MLNLITFLLISVRHNQKVKYLLHHFIKTLFLFNHTIHSIIKPCASKFKGCPLSEDFKYCFVKYAPHIWMGFFNNGFFLTLGTEVSGDRWLQVCNSVDYIHLQLESDTYFYFFLLHVSKFIFTEQDNLRILNI